MNQGGGTLRDPVRRNVTETQMSARLSKVNKGRQKIWHIYTSLFLTLTCSFVFLRLQKVGNLIKMTGKVRLKCKNDCNLQPSFPIFHSLLLNLMPHI